MPFKDATNTTSFAKIGILGFAGAGKTRTATEMAIGLHAAIKSKKPIGFIDSETGSDFVLPLFTKRGIGLKVSKTRAFRDLAEGMKQSPGLFDILIIDSLSHFWVDIVESYRKKKNVNRLSFGDWAIIKPMWNDDFSSPFVMSAIHIIVCGRAGFEYDYFEGDDGKMELYKTGTKMKAENEFGFEPSLVIEMERIKNPNLTEEYRAAKTKDQKLKAARSMAADREFVRRATVLKDRSDIMDGMTFDNPTYADFAPHWQAINLGGEHMPLEGGDSTELFNRGGQPAWQIEKRRSDIAREEIRAELDKVFPSSSANEKKARIRILEFVLDTSSATAIESMKTDKLIPALRRIKTILTVPENTVENLAAGKIMEPPKDEIEDIPEFGPIGDLGQTTLVEGMEATP